MLQRVDYDQCIYHVKQNNLRIKPCVQIAYWKCSTSFFLHIFLQFFLEHARRRTSRVVRMSLRDVLYRSLLSNLIALGFSAQYDLFAFCCIYFEVTLTTLLFE